MRMRVFVIAALCACLAGSAYAAVFTVAPGDVAGLAAAIDAANSDAQADTISIAGSYVLTAVDNVTHGNNGLPSITSPITIVGTAGATIRRSDAAGTPAFRILHVGETGSLTLRAVTIANGLLPHTDFDWEGSGAGILSIGNLSIADSVITGNVAGDDAGGIAQVRAGTTFSMRDSVVSNNGVEGGQNVGGMTVCCNVSIARSTIADNFGVGLALGGINQPSTGSGNAEFVDSSVFRNHAVGPIAGIIAGGHVRILNTTIALNTAGGGGPAAIFFHSGDLSIVNSTIANNSSAAGERSTGGIRADPLNAGRVELTNTIVAGNTAAGAPSDCNGAVVTSLGNNLIGSTAGCTIALLGSDRLGDAGLAPFTDDGTPGNGHFPLLPTSAAVNAGNNVVCQSDPALATDQIGNPRVGVCDIGAIEFQPAPPSVVFAGTPGTPSCHGDSVSALARQYRGLSAAARALGFSSVQSLQNAVKTFCRE